METINYLKPAVAAAGGWLLGATMPALPYTAVCTAMVVADVVTARRLAARLRRRVPSARQRLKFSSAKLSATVMKLVRIYSLLLLTALVQYVIAPEFELLRWVGAGICFIQLLSMIENEAAACDAPWARIAGRILVDKTERHLGIRLDELHRFTDPVKDNEQ